MPKWEDRLDILRVVARKVPIESDVDLHVRAGGDIVTGVLGQREAHYLNHDQCPVVSRGLW